MHLLKVDLDQTPQKKKILCLGGCKDNREVYLGCEYKFNSVGHCGFNAFNINYSD